MATIDFLPFATGSGANVMSQAEWAALTQRLSGFQSGVAQSAQLNKAWRQSSIMAAVIAQFISDITGQDVIDDGTTASILANLKAAVSSQSPGVAGTMRNGRMSITAASATATFTADEIVVESTLGGLSYRLANFSSAINLTTTGAGGMNSGQAPASGFVAIYAIYNPRTGATALLGKDATSAAQPEVYSGTGMPSGYTASALVSVWPTNASRQFSIGYQRDREIFTTYNSMLITSTQQASLTALSAAAYVPPNAKTLSGDGSISSTVDTNGDIFVAGATAGNIGLKHITQTAIKAGAAQIGTYSYVPLVEPQKIYYVATVSAGTMTATIYISSYTF
ncbi:hypothetical protein N6G05_26715 [Cupriavidus gilardii]|uniref:hypothetical protein n=1 Tax=Cupriavidus gilardii TaxID=82541 RepID=UPI0021C157A4|nr:hypothetical protein [Cupriavidus gilardii]MCT9017148.1 hypothetical protein [Cupriavidus gilardii]MCT9056817.1 hypothetical protein [Cupriavidus gilardii]